MGSHTQQRFGYFDMRLLLGFLTALLWISAPVSAGDIGTYRPGVIYLSIPAQSPEQCVSQCAGDAQCKSWNFVAVTPSKTICEFNARKSQPVRSAISISGENYSVYDSAKVIPAGRRTYRVGQSVNMMTHSPGSTSLGMTTRVGAVPPPYPHAQPNRPAATQKPSSA